MHKVKAVFYFFTLVMGFFLLLISCSPKSGYEVRSFLFDGVPNPHEEIQVVMVDTVLLAKQDSIALANKLSIEPVFNVHPPYREKKCNDCHNPSHMGQLVMPEQELCFSCHDTFTTAYSVMHGPAESGNCTQCHDPHKSKLESLLVAEGQSVCLSCHDEKKVKGYAIHKTIEETNCTSCHNPHGGENAFFLQPKACYQCHTNFEEQYTYMHGPAADGAFCGACHEGHTSKNSSLLAVSGNTLCLNCHEQASISMTSIHKESKNQDCMSCHDPHGSNQSYLLTEKP